MLTTELTSREKEAIRTAPCGRCGKYPPFADGSRCHPHRIIPGCRGGKYTKKNTIPRCPKCHSEEHENLFALVAIKGGQRGALAQPHWAKVKGGRLGGRKRMASLLPAERTALGKKAGLIGGRRVHIFHPELAVSNGRKYGKAGAYAQPIAAKVLGGQRATKALRAKLTIMQWVRYQRLRTRTANHLRWHIRRGLTNLACILCRS